MPNKLSQFWQELKRRKVVRTMAVYAATAYIIIEAGDIILPRLGVPDWTVTFLIILMIVGFPVIMILSWVFDMTPDGIRKTEQIDPEKELQESGARKKRRLRASDAIIAILLVVVGILLYPRVFNKNRVETLHDDIGRISIAVMPFQNMTQDTLWNVWQAGIQNDLITNLSNSEELSVRSYDVINSLLGRSEQTNVASFSFSKAGDISRRLEANTFIHGTIKSAGGMVRINAHLIDSKSEEIYKTFQIDGQGEEEIFVIIDSLANLVRDYLEIRVLEKDMFKGMEGQSTTQSPEAFRYYIQGLEIYMGFDWESSIAYFDRALEIDSLFSLALLYKVWAYHNIGENGNLEMLERSKENLQKLLTRQDELPIAMQQMVMYLKSDFDKDPFAGIRFVNMLLEDAPQSMAWWQQGLNYQRVGQDEKALECYERILDLVQQWGGTEGWPVLYTYPGGIYHRLGDHRRENEIYKYGLSLNPGNRSIIANQVVCALSQGDEATSADLLAKFRNLLEAAGADRSRIDFSTGQVYRRAGMHDEALDIFRELLREDPGNTRAIFQIASILINQEKDLDEGVRLVEGILINNPGNWDLLFLKGQGLYKLGRIEEAYQILSEAWDLRPFYHHEHYQLLDELERAVSRQE